MVPPVAIRQFSGNVRAVFDTKPTRTTSKPSSNGSVPRPPTPTPTRTPTRTSSSSSTQLPFPLPVPSNIFDTGRQVANEFCNTLESFIEAYVDPREYPPSRDPKVQLEGNFAPVHECPPTKCTKVTGLIPECIRGGAYLRNGSNPLYPPPAGYHYFDGHGMLHVIKFPDDDSVPTYSARFTQTSRYLQDKAAGRSLFPNSFGDMSSVQGIARLGLFAARTVLGLIDIFNGIGTSNAGMAFYDGKILAMSEEDMPHAVRLQEDGDIVTLGRYNFRGDLILPMCAHPKIDPDTGELFAFSFNPVVNPYIRFFHASPDGKKSSDFPISLPESCLLHDFAVTKNYAVFPENQLVMKPENLVLGKPPMGRDSSKVTRFGVLPRYSTSSSSVKWFDVPDWTAFHYVNAWEEGQDKIVVLGSCISPVDELFDNIGDLTSRLMEIHLDMRTGRASKQHVCSAGIDFGQMNQRFYGRKNRYAYMCYFGPWPKFSGLAKIDLDAARLPRMVDSSRDPDLDEPCIVASRRFQKGKFCGEPFFVSRSEDGEEDDGYVLTYVHDENSDVSELLIMDARSATLEIVASITMPVRVPYGFHGIFLSANQIASQDLKHLN